jgi:hypothetical protein
MPAADQSKSEQLMKQRQRWQRSLHFSLWSSWPQRGHQRQHSPGELLMFGTAFTRSLHVVARRLFLSHADVLAESRAETSSPILASCGTFARNASLV